MATLGIDIGTFESKAVLVDGQGRVLAQAARPHQMAVPRPGRAEHDADTIWWAETVALIRDLLGQGIAPEQIEAVACSAIGPCLLPVDAGGRALRPGILYGVDTRAAAEIDALTAQIGADTILARCGNALTSQAVGPKILWLQRHEPDIWAQTARIMGATTWLTWRLTGESVIDHYSAAGYAPLYDIAAQDWAEDIAPGLCPRSMLPRLAWTTEIAGHVTAAAAAETGLRPGTPVTCGTIDAAAEAVSVGTMQSGEMMVMYGSTIFVILLSDRRLHDPRLWHAPWLFAGQAAAMAGLATSGTLTHWFRDRFAADLPREEAFGLLAAEAATSPPGARGLIVLPHFSGERTPIHDPLACGAIFGLNLTHGRGDIYRAVIEGIACATRAITDTLTEAGQPPARIRAVGGGTRNALWLQATSDLTGLDQQVCTVSLGAAYGNAFLAALALGQVTRSDINHWNPPAQTVTARDEPAYRRLYPRYQRLYAQTRDLAHEIGGEPI